MQKCPEKDSSREIQKTLLGDSQDLLTRWLIPPSYRPVVSRTEPKQRKRAPKSNWDDLYPRINSFSRAASFVIVIGFLRKSFTFRSGNIFSNSSRYTSKTVKKQTLVCPSIFESSR